jgi:uncharacterized protein YeaO (DUF488 family)
MISTKRIYEPADSNDGYRILVDRLWPRGVSKEKAALDLWFKEIAPSPELRIWFGHDPKRFSEFAARYKQELVQNPAVGQLQKIIKNNKTVTLLYAAHDTNINHAKVLLDFMRQKSAT